MMPTRIMRHKFGLALYVELNSTRIKYKAFQFDDLKLTTCKDQNFEYTEITPITVACQVSSGVLL